MLLSEIMMIKNSISKHREEICRLAKSKGSSHPEVLKARKQLNSMMMALQQKCIR
ncbi:hypothetical protein [Pseudobacillus wudalianchiensis]|uniref:hypothetical protein n=1 Tax=Pseudobacillus wudalianchiensis TaxID=1743143 RepID=UPI00159F1D9E|nr:hypothetical protein [Bacillus wudalianchiensis]